MGDKIKFSKKEIDLLKTLDEIQKNAGTLSTILMSAPFVMLLSSPKPFDVAITIGTTDWENIFESFSAIDKIVARRFQDEYIFWKLKKNSHSSKQSKAFFKKIYERAGQKL